VRFTSGRNAGGLLESRAQWRAMRASFRPGILELSALGAFIACWFLPVMDDINGWLAFRASMNPLWSYSGDSRVVGLELPEDLAFLLGALTNFVFVGVCAWLPFAARRGLRNAAIILAACFIIDSYSLTQIVISRDWTSLQPGYYAWLAAFGLLGTAAYRRMRAEPLPAGT
jgi:hypothetical protein